MIYIGGKTKVIFIEAFLSPYPQILWSKGYLKHWIKTMITKGKTGQSWGKGRKNNCPQIEAVSFLSGQKVFSPWPPLSRRDEDSWVLASLKTLFYFLKTRRELLPLGFNSGRHAWRVHENQRSSSNTQAQPPASESHKRQVWHWVQGYKS